jgi:hypothetical protein
VLSNRQIFLNKNYFLAKHCFSFLCVAGGFFAILIAKEISRAVMHLKTTGLERWNGIFRGSERIFSRIHGEGL